MTGLVTYTVNVEVQSKFFAEINKELGKIEKFFKGKYLSSLN